MAERLRACGPWVQAMRRRMLPLSPVGPLPAGLRVVVIDARSSPAPGAPGTDHRLHSAMALLSWPFIEVLVRDVHTGATLTPVTLAPGDGAVTDRGSAHCHGRRAAVKQGAERIVRLQPVSVVRSDAAGAPVERCAVWKRQQTETLRTRAVALRSTGGQHAGRGWVHA